MSLQERAPGRTGGRGRSPIGPDNFYCGTVRRLFRAKRRGIIRSQTGRDIPFTFVHVDMVGTLRRFEGLRVGMRVGFDVGWTAKGLRVTVIRATPPLGWQPRKRPARKPRRRKRPAKRRASGKSAPPGAPQKPPDGGSQ